MRRAAAVLGLGAVASQAGHLLVYQLQFGSAAANVQSQGVHAYFPAFAKTSLGIAALVFIAGLLVVGASRLATGRPIRTTSRPPLLPLLSLLFTFQLTVFVLQESVEAVLAGYTPHVGSLLFLGAVGQLPVAALTALALKWLATRLDAALIALRTELAVAVTSFAPASLLIPLPAPTPAPALAEACPAVYIKRGPPAILRA